MRKLPPITDEEVRAEYERVMCESHGKEVDERALSRKELSCLLDRARSSVVKTIRKKLKEGAWERVWKHDEQGKLLIPAYRPKKVREAK